MVHQQAKACVLIVEDDTDNREALSTLLHSEGYSLLSATNGAEALALLKKGAHPDIILLDMMMPKMTGLEFLRQRRHLPKGHDIPTVIFSADAHIANEASRLGAHGYLSKPVDIDELLHTLDSFVGS